MKQITAILSLVLMGFAVSAQSNNNYSNATDTLHRHHAFRNWNHNGYDSVRKGDFNRFRGQRGEAMNHFNGRGEGMNRQRGFGDQRRGDWGMARIRFSPEQRKQQMEISKDFRQKSSDLYKNDKLTLGQYKAQLLALKKEKKSKIEALLTPEQKSKIAAWKKKRSDDAQVMAAAHLERMRLNLDLTDQQVAKIKAQQAGMRSQMKAIHENDNISQDQKREQMKSLMAKRKDEMKSILTPDQLSKFEKMHTQRMGDWHERSGERNSDWKDSK